MDNVQEINPQIYKTAGWIAIIAGVLMWLLIVFTFFDPSVRTVFSFKFESLLIVQILFTIYPLWRFRGLLNDNFQFHNVDGLISGLAITYAALIIVELAIVILNFSMGDAAGSSQLPPSPPFIAYIVGVGGVRGLVSIVASIVWIVFALRILRLPDDLRGMLRPFAITTIVANALCLTIILAPFGTLVHSVCFIMLGMIFLRMANPPAQVDFV
jgi:hypothetical protein